jgi:hypothetical protein
VDLLWTGKDSKNIDDGEHLPLQGQARADLPARKDKGWIRWDCVESRLWLKQITVLIKALAKKFLQETNMKHLVPLPDSLFCFLKPYQARPSLKVCEGTVKGRRDFHFASKRIHFKQVQLFEYAAVNYRSLPCLGQFLVFYRHEDCK